MKTFPAKLLSTALLAVCLASPAFAANDPLVDVLLDFEGVSSFESIAQYYNGGADGAGQVGPALGVSFGGDAIGLINDELGPYFSHAPSPIGVMTPVGAQATMNVQAGFAKGLLLSYSSSSAVTSGVQIWSGLDGTGSLLASINLAANAQANGCSDSAYCHFDQAIGAFTGLAHSVTFGNATYAAVIDNVHIGAVPEPDTVAMLLVSLGCFVAASVRRRG